MREAGRAWESPVRSGRGRSRITGFACEAGSDNRPQGDSRGDQSRCDASTSVGCSAAVAAAYAGRDDALSVCSSAGSSSRRRTTRRPHAARGATGSSTARCSSLASGSAPPALVSSARHGLHGPLLVVDAIGGAALCLALWWRRRWPVGSRPGLAAGPGRSPSSAGPAGLIILFTVAAYRRWQLAVLVAALQVALLPVGRVVHPQGNSLAAYYLVGTLGHGGGRRVGHVPPRAPPGAAGARSATPRPSSSCASSRSATPSARGSRARCTTCSPTGSRC